MIGRVLPNTMRSRLAVLFALSTSIILAVSATLLYEAISASTLQSLKHEMQGSLANAITHIDSIKDLDEIRSGGATTFTAFANPEHHAKLDFAIFDDDGSVVVKSDGFSGGDDVLRAQIDAIPVWVQAADRAIRYVAAIAPLTDGPPAGRVRIAIQGDFRDAIAFLHLCALSIVIGVFGGAVVAAIVADRIAAFALEPLRRLAARADEISCSQLAHPLPDADMAGELRELSQAFNRMLTRLDESFSRLTQFSSDLAHDIRTPLTNLLAQAQVALSQPRSNEQYRAIIESSVEEFQRLSRMVDDMLFLARTDARQHTMQFQRVDAGQEVLRVARYYESIAQDRGIAIAVNGHCSFDGDPLLVQRALGNLLSNACAHAPSGSSVTIQCVCCGDVAIVAVADEGPGIAEEHWDRIFDRFYRLDPARQNSATGTGLGLAIVKSIMNKHSGECRVHSIPGVRTTFSLHFPREQR